MNAKRVLIAEDEPHIVESLRFILSREGYDVDDAGDGESACRSLAAALRCPRVESSTCLPTC